MNTETIKPGKKKIKLRGNVIACPHSKRTLMHYVYWQTGMVIFLTSLASLVSLINNNEYKGNYILRYYFIFNIIKCSFMALFITTFFYPTRYFHIQNWVLTEQNWDDRAFFYTQINFCTIGMTVLISYQIGMLIMYTNKSLKYFYDEIDYVYIIVFCMELIDIFYLKFAVWYRITRPISTFWLAIYGDVKATKVANGMCIKYTVCIYVANIHA